MTKRLLLIDPIPTHRIRLKAALRAAQYDIVSVDRIACATGAMLASPADLIILNTSGVAPGQMMSRLRKALGSSEVPILCRDEDAGPLRRIEAMSTGARDMIATRVPLPLLLARLRGLLRDQETSAELQRRRVATASFGFHEAESSFDIRARIFAARLGKSGDLWHDEDLPGTYDVSAVTREVLLRNPTGSGSPDAILLDVARDADDQLESVLPEIRMRGHLRQASVLVVYPAGAHDIAHRALNLGASEIAEDTSTGAELVLRMETMLSRKRARDALRRSAEESFRLAITDSLTGLYNRRYSETYLADALASVRETGRGLTVLMIDIDYFKRINDTHGHAAGDNVLRAIALRIRDNLRAVDLVSRHGGEEFLVILPGIDGSDAELAAERLRAEIASYPVVVPGVTELTVTASVGVACAIPQDVAAFSPSPPSAHRGSPGSAADRLLARADEALYEAKRAGRNRIAISPPAASAA